jgi:DNA-binding response OmpR family regulator/tetratricopeptide (TPR) repeat protein
VIHLVGQLPDEVLAELFGEGTGVASNEARAAVLVVVDAPEASGWEALDALRMAGERRPAVVVSDHSVNDGLRPMFEPVTHLRPPVTGPQLTEAIVALRARSPWRSVRLPAGMVHLATSRMVRRDGTEVKLSPREVDLLGYLLVRPQQDIPRRELQEQVWGHVIASKGRAVDMAVSRLRKKIERDPRHPEVVRSTRGGGYRFCLPRTVPRPEAELIGRERELREVEDHLTGSGSVQITGPAGMGTSRLAREVVARWVEERGGDAFWVRLQGIDEPGRLWAAVAGGMGFDISAAVDDAEAADLVERQLALCGPGVVVLDGAEGAVEVLADRWQQGMPTTDLRVVVTSRRRLPLSSLPTVRLSPLAPAHARSLFGARARSVGAVLEGPVDEIVARLDGLALAVELAAGRLRSGTRAELLEELDEPLEALRDGARALVNGLRSSVESLSEPGTEALARLARVHGSVPRTLARALVGTRELDELVDASLVVVERGRGRTWVGTLATVRSFVTSEHVVAFPPERCEAVARWAHRQRRRLDGASGREASEVVAGCAEALVPLVWDLVEHARHEAAAALACVIDRHLHTHASQRRRRVFLDRALSGLPARYAARLHLARASATLEGDRTAVVGDDLQAAELDPELRVDCALLRSQIARWRGDLVEAQTALTQLRDDLVDDDVVHRARVAAQHLMHRHLAEGARASLQAATSLEACEPELHRLERLDVVAKVQQTLVVVYGNLGDLRLARATLDRLRRTTVAIADEAMSAWADSMIGWVEMKRGDYAEARRHAAAATARLDSMGMTTRALYAAQRWALAALHAGEHDEADTVIARVEAGTMARDRAHVLELRALWQLDTGRCDAALATIDEAVQWGASGGDAILLADLASLRGLALALAGRPREAWSVLAAVDASVLPTDHAHLLQARRVALRPEPELADELRGALRDVETASARELAAWLDGARPLHGGVDVRLLARLCPAGVRARARGAGRAD